MSATDFALALGVIFGFCGLLCLVEWLLDRIDRAEQAPAPVVDLAAVRADDQLLDRIAAGEKRLPSDDEVTQLLKAWREAVDYGLDDRVTEWQTLLGSDDQS